MGSRRDAEIAKEERVRHAHDVETIAQLVLASPHKHGKEVVNADGDISMEDLVDSNTDVQTRIILRMANKAIANGDVKAAEFVFKVAGLTMERQEVTLDVPQIIDDMECRATPTPPSPLAEPDDYLIDDMSTQALEESCQSSQRSSE